MSLANTRRQQQQGGGDLARIAQALERIGDALERLSQLASADGVALMVRCYRCEGTGKIEGGEPCQMCSGSGRIRMGGVL